MSDEKPVPTVEESVEESVGESAEEAEDDSPERARWDKILKAKELYSRGSRSFLVRSYAEAADELSEVCALYEELYGELADELGMPYLLYAKSLISLALDENKVIDVPEQDGDETDEEETEPDEAVIEPKSAGPEEAEVEPEQPKKLEPEEAEAKPEQPKKLKPEEAGEKADSEKAGAAATQNGLKAAPLNSEKEAEEVGSSAAETAKSPEKMAAKESVEVASTTDSVPPAAAEDEKEEKVETSAPAPVTDGEVPSTSNGNKGGDGEEAEELEDEEYDAGSNLQLAWEILELAGKIFSRQGYSGLPNLAEVKTELANIEFENNILDAAREDYEKALQIYSELPVTNYRRAMAEIYYKIGLTHVMNRYNKEGAESLKMASKLIEAEIEEIKAKPNITDKDKHNIQDMEETKQEIMAKIEEVLDAQAWQVAGVRAALDSYIKPIGGSENDEDAGPSSSAASASPSGSGTSPTVYCTTFSSAPPNATSSTSSSKQATDISHLIKRKKPEEPSAESEAAASPAKRPAL